MELTYFCCSTEKSCAVDACFVASKIGTFERHQRRYNNFVCRETCRFFFIFLTMTENYVILDDFIDNRKEGTVGEQVPLTWWKSRSNSFLMDSIHFWCFSVRFVSSLFIWSRVKNKVIQWVFCGSVESIQTNTFIRTSKIRICIGKLFIFLFGRQIYEPLSRFFFMKISTFCWQAIFFIDILWIFNLICLF